MIVRYLTGRYIWEYSSEEFRYRKRMQQGAESPRRRRSQAPVPFVIEVQDRRLRTVVDKDGVRTRCIALRGNVIICQNV